MPQRDWLVVSVALAAMAIVALGHPEMGILKISRAAVLVLACLACIFVRAMAGRDLDKLSPLASGQLESRPPVNGHCGYKHPDLTANEVECRALAFYELVAPRRSIRFIDTKPVPLAAVSACVAAAGTAPSGAHCQPWHFAIVSSPEKKALIRGYVEAEEELNYQKRMGRDWAAECIPLVSGLPDSHVKPYLTDAPHLIVVVSVTISWIIFQRLGVSGCCFRRCCFCFCIFVQFKIPSACSVQGTV